MALELLELLEEIKITILTQDSHGLTFLIAAMNTAMIFKDFQPYNNSLLVNPPFLWSLPTCIDIVVYPALYIYTCMSLQYHYAIKYIILVAIRQCLCVYISS